LKNKKAISLIAIYGACLMFVFSVLIFPFILAATPKNQEIETIEIETAHPAEESANPDDSRYMESLQREIVNWRITPDINAISKETAISIVLEKLSLGGETYESAIGETRMTSLELRGASYIERVDHIDAPIWRVLFYERSHGETFVYIYVVPDLEDAQSIESRLGEFCCSEEFIGEDNRGFPVIISSYSYENLYFIDVNAFNGEIIGQGVVGMCDHEGTKREFSYDDAIDWEMLKEIEDTYYHILNDLRELNHPKPEPNPIPADPEHAWKDAGDGLIRVPNLIGSTQTEVVAAFSEVNLVLEIHLVESNSPNGIVVYISDAGGIVSEGTVINIHVSTGRMPPFPTPEPSPIPIT